MTEERLEKYRALKLEIAQLENRIRNMKIEGPQETSDSVSTSVNFPYSKHTLVISGFEDITAYNKRLSRLQANLSKSQAELEELDEYIASVPDACIRTIMQYKYMDGAGWKYIARKFGWRDETTPHKKIKKFLEHSGFSGFSGL